MCRGYAMCCECGKHKAVGLMHYIKRMFYCSGICYRRHNGIN